jgi:hypothetical protein
MNLTILCKLNIANDNTYVDFYHTEQKEKIHIYIFICNVSRDRNRNEKVA